MASALKASSSLRSATHSTGVRIDWKIDLWRANMLRFQSVANEAWREALDADLIVLAGCRGYSLSPWLKEWLEGWVSCRQVRDAALAFVEDNSTGLSPATKESELFRFAESHNLGFRDSGSDVYEKGKSQGSLLKKGKPSRSRRNT
jgi:hypothetical protein